MKWAGVPTRIRLTAGCRTGAVTPAPPLQVKEGRITMDNFRGPSLLNADHDVRCLDDDVYLFPSGKTEILTGSLRDNGCDVKTGGDLHDYLGVDGTEIDGPDRSLQDIPGAQFHDCSLLVTCVTGR